MTPPEQDGQQDHRSTGEFVALWVIAALAVMTSTMKTVIIAPLISEGAVGTMDKVGLYTGWISIELLWLWTLLWEWAHRDNRHRVRFARRYRWITIALYFAIVGAGDWEHKNFHGTLGAVLVVGLFFAVWKSWTSTNALHPEDQKVLDEIVDRQEDLLRQRFEEDVKRRRDARLQAAINRITRYSTPATLVETASERDLPTATWPIPNGRHEPVVYFLRNGNRIKIGTTTDIRQRIRRLSLRPEDITLLISGDRATEQQLHRAFANLRVGNTEWFHLAEPLTTFIAEKVASRTDAGFPGQ